MADDVRVDENLGDIDQWLWACLQISTTSPSMNIANMMAAGCVRESHKPQGPSSWCRLNVLAECMFDMLANASQVYNDTIV